MKSVRIESIGNGKEFLIDITCECGNNIFTDVTSGIASSKHKVSLGGGEVGLRCTECKKRCGIFPQVTNVYVYMH